MAWYKNGTVAATTGQTTVTGTDTKFATNARVGDGFNGPDGNWYEVTNIASETVIAIFPAYQGATTPSSSNYMIAPLQGYNKESADRLRAITDSLTVVKSVAGKTGDVTLVKSDVGLSNVDNTSDLNKPLSNATNSALASVNTAINGKKNNFTVLPVTEGGTGSTTAEDLRSTLLLAKSGVNGDITSLTGITTPLSVQQGGTGDNSGGAIFTGSTTSTNGSKGLVPPPLIADKDKVLKGDGTWATIGLGIGQSWTDVSSSRALTTAYVNTTGRPIVVNGWVLQGSSGFTSCIVGAITLQRLTTTATGINTLNFSFIVPSGATYAISVTSGVATLGSWLELR